MVLDVLVESGIVGLFLFAISIFQGTGICSRIRRSAPFFLTLQGASLLALLCVGLFAMIGEEANTTFCTMYSWLALGICYIAFSGRLRVFHLGPISAVTKGVTIALLVLLLGAYVVRESTELYSNTLTLQAIRLPSDPPKTKALLLARAIQFDPWNLSARNILAQVALNTKHFQVAQEQLQAIQEQQPFFANIHQGLGFVAFAQKRYPEAIRELQIAQRCFPMEYETQIQLAKAYFLVGDYENCQLRCAFILGNGLGTPDAQRLWAMNQKKLQ